MVRRLSWLLLAGALAALGLLGLLVPFFPGIPLLVAAALCASIASRRVNARLLRNPTWRRFRRRWDAGAGLGLVDRARLAFWLSADSVLPRR